MSCMRPPRRWKAELTLINSLILKLVIYFIVKYFHLCFSQISDFKDVTARNRFNGFRPKTLSKILEKERDRNFDPIKSTFNYVCSKDEQTKPGQMSFHEGEIVVKTKN